MCLFSKPKKPNYGKVVAITLGAVAAVAGIAYLVYKFFFEYKYCDCDCDCEDDDVYEITCPNCGEEVYVDGETLENEDVYCPSCRQMIELDLPEGCDCGCDCDCDCE